MGCGTSGPMPVNTAVVTQTHVPRTYFPTVVVPQPQRVIHVQHQMPLMPVPMPLPAVLPIQPPPVKVITKVLIERFVFLSQSIAKLEHKDIISLLHSTNKKSSDLQAEINQLRQKCAELEHFIQSAPHLNRNAAAANLLGATASEPEKEMTAEEKAHHEAWVNLDVTKKQIEQMEARFKKLQEQNVNLKKENDQYFGFMNEQDQILEQAFGGIYGSDLEDELEEKLDRLIKNQQFFKSTMDRWRVSQNRFTAASQQLNLATQRWNQFVVRVPISTSYDFNMVKLRAISDIRNILISAHQNLCNAQKPLVYGPQKLPLPYCTPDELNSLQRALNNVLFDASTRQRQVEAGSFYTRMAGRASVLGDMLEKLHVKIAADMKQVVGECNRVRSGLRHERVKLMKQTAAEAGVEVDIDDSAMEESELSLDSDDSSDEEMDVAKVEETESPEDLEKEIEEAKAQMKDEDVVVGAILVADQEDDDAKMSLDELAPAPSKNELLGNLDTIMAAYEEQKNAHIQEQESAKAKQEAQIKEKLRRKKSMKMREVQMAME